MTGLAADRRRRRQLAALDAYIQTGSIKGAAHRLGLDETAVRRRLAGYCKDNRTNLPQAVYDLGRRRENLRISGKPSVDRAFLFANTLRDRV